MTARAISGCVWQAGPVGRRQIYAARYTPDADTYNRSVQVSRSTGDHCNPAIAIDGTGTVYVVWQENASGKWDIYMATLSNWNTSSLRRVPDSTSGATVTMNRTNPAIAVSRQSSGLGAIVWQDDRAGNQDIYVTKSTNKFQTSLSYRVTSNTANQTNPAIAIDSLDTIVLVWTDARHGSTDIYGATSASSTWANVPVVSAGSNQSSPKVAAGSSGHVLYLTWVDNASGNPDIFYARTDGLPTSPLTGVNIGDDTSGAAQQAPAIAAVAGPNGNDRVFLCWEDGRNVRYSGKTELYFAEVGTGAIRANVPVDNDGIAGNQHNRGPGPRSARLPLRAVGGRSESDGPDLLRRRDVRRPGASGPSGALCPGRRHGRHGAEPDQYLERCLGRDPGAGVPMQRDDQYRADSQSAGICDVVAAPVRVRAERADVHPAGHDHDSVQRLGQFDQQDALVQHGHGCFR